MDLLGYGPLIRKTRREAYTELDRFRVKYVDRWLFSITTGSKAEGLTCVFKNDIDQIFVARNAMCLEEGIDQSTISGDIDLFNMNFQTTSAGYCRLLQGRHGPIGPIHIINALCEDGCGNFVLSSTLYLEQYTRVRLPGILYHASVGPSLPCSTGQFRLDKVHAIRCHCPSILQTWANRLRNWPPQKVIAMGAFVAPIGFKGSAFNHLEWRICVNTAETELVNNLNDTQVKIYVILKMVVHDVLSPNTKEITSYILKNIVLWLAENNPQEVFHSGSLFHWLHGGFDILQKSISTRHLSYYMIPERTFMAERDLHDNQQREFATSINCIMNEGPRLLLRLKKIRRAIVSHPEPLLWYSRMRTKLEILYLMMLNRFQCTDFNGICDESDSMIHSLSKRAVEIAVEVVWHMHQEGS
ncbi:hypothetical protein DPMN_072261 [Dreissena polymorpha]|uniref:Mab-21-like HhH/H2TH-like domain-containing protein n=2 Tax=Dreissena polymorpha TaxID=45954 RepID=A0A9D3Z8E6_DREPO|nr:hypothetical protein DPMN_072261 [Dreissena polymorpha]